MDGGLYTYSKLVARLSGTVLTLRSKISTLPEFLERRCCPASRSILAFMVDCRSSIHSHRNEFCMPEGCRLSAILWHQRTAMSILIVAAAVSIYTVLGGLRAVVLTESVNTVVLLVGATCITAFAIAALPMHGIHTLQEFRAAVKPG